MIPKIDNLDELVFDFNKEALGKMLPKLRTNLVHLKRIWKDYLNDIIYLINNNSIFYNKECVQLIIEQRMINFLIVLFLFHKNYKFINSDSLRKFGVLLSQFINTVSKEVLALFLELRGEFDLFLSENNKINDNLNELKSNFENITFETLITKRIEIQNIIIQKIKEKEKNFEKINQQKMREKNLENNNLAFNGGEEIAILGKNNKFIFEENMENDTSRNKYKEFSISKKDLYEGRLDNNIRSSKSRRPSSRVIESFNTVNRNSNSNNNLLHLTHGNSSVNDTPHTEINRNPSSDLDSNKNNNSVNEHKYKFKYSNVALKKIDDVSKVINTKNNLEKGNNQLGENNENNQNEIINNHDKVNNNNLDNQSQLKSKINNNNKNSNKINSENQSNIDNEGKENEKNMLNENNKINNKKEDSDQFYHSPSFSKNDFRKEDDKNDKDKNNIIFNKGNDYSFKNSINNSTNNFNQNISNLNNNKQNNSKLNNSTKKSSKKSSKNNSNVISHKKLNNNNEDNKGIRSTKKNNNNYISFKDNNSDYNNEENIDINNYSLLSDNELQKINQTLSDINEINIENNNPKNYMTYPFEKNNDVINVIKEIPMKVKKRLSSYCMKLIKEKKIRRVSNIDNMIPSLKELDNKINQIRKEINLIDVNEYYNVKIEKLHFQESEEDKEMDDKLYKMADELNNEFYNDIEEKLNIAQEKLNELVL